MTLDAAALGLATELHADTAMRLLPVVAALVDRYAPGAPDAISNEAAVRCAGWLAEQPGASVRGETMGDISTSWAPTMHSALRHSGAMALLTAWKVRRAGAI